MVEKKLLRPLKCGKKSEHTGDEKRLRDKRVAAHQWVQLCYVLILYKTVKALKSMEYICI